MTLVGASGAVTTGAGLLVSVGAGLVGAGLVGAGLVGAGLVGAGAWAGWVNVTVMVLLLVPLTRVGFTSCPRALSRWACWAG